MSNNQHNQNDMGSPRRAELTPAAFFLGLILSVVMGAANVYLGLKAGMTVSASIPASVIAMGVLAGVFRRRSVLESNMVQTSASAGESLAAGIIFTMPALVLAGIWETFDFWTTSLIALSGGLLGILFMIPMRRVFVVDNTELKFPEGVACAEVLRAGENELDDQDIGNSGATLVFLGILLGGMFKVFGSFVGLLRGHVEWAMLRSSRVFYFGADISPALLAVGYIVGLPIAVQIFMGGSIGWLIAIPLLGATAGSSESAVDQAWGLWSTQVRYIGVGAMIVGGITSIWKVRGGLLAAVSELRQSMSRQTNSADVADTERNLSGGTIIALTIGSILLVGGLYYSLLGHNVGITLLTTSIMVVMAFFFTAVASYIVGLVGNSNSPVSGMTITAVLGTGGLIFLFGYSGEQAMLATLGVAGIVCCAACTAGDVCNDLKTGHLVGASPRSQQIMQVAGVLVAAFVMAPVMVVLHEGSMNNGTGGIGGRDLPAPQAALFAALANGFFGNGHLPWTMIAYGMGVGLAILIVDFVLLKRGSAFRLHVMPVAVGIYLPFGLAVPIILGGLLNALVSRHRDDREIKRGVLLTSGIIAGESLVGVMLGLLAYLEFKSLAGADWALNQLGWQDHADNVMQAVSAGALVLVAWWVYRQAVGRRR